MNIFGYVSDYVGSWLYPSTTVVPDTPGTTETPETKTSAVRAYSTLQLKKYIDTLEQSTSLAEFLEMCPASANYLIIPKENMSNEYGIVHEITEEHHVSSTKISDHLNLRYLTPKCKIGLTQEQRSLIGLTNFTLVR